MILVAHIWLCGYYKMGQYVCNVKNINRDASQNNGEIRQLEIINFLNRTHPIDLVPTFLAQGIPFEYENKVDQLTDEIVKKWIPEIAKRKLAEYCDVFCEKGYFNVEQSRRILETGKNTA
jgi:imidazolonepropionase-like amidohydrolase